MSDITITAVPEGKVSSIAVSVPAPERRFTSVEVTAPPTQSARAVQARAHMPSAAVSSARSSFFFM